MARAGGLVGRALELAETRLGYTVERVERIEHLEEADVTRRSLQRELESLGYGVMDYFSGRGVDLMPEERRMLVQKAALVWMKDPQAGASADLMNDFVFGRGVPKPKAKDTAVQKVIDETWDDPRNQRVLTGYAAQLALGLDLTIQSNVFMLLFDDGADGRVVMSILEHDAVENAVTHQEDRFCVLWFVARMRRYEWDFKHHIPKAIKMTRERIDPATGGPRVFYYEHWRNYREALDEYEKTQASDLPMDEPPQAPDPRDVGVGKVFHLYVNKRSEMLFGHPTMDRTIRWFAAYNQFMEARVDMMRAAASFIMKRQVKGTPQQLATQATKAYSMARGAYADVDGGPYGVGPKPASVINENDAVTHTPFALSTGSQDAVGDGRMLGGQISAATRWPRSYYGDADASNLATATSLELPVLKSVEARQELFEGLFRFLIDRSIERAVETGRIAEELTPEEVAARRKAEGSDLPTDPDADSEDGARQPADLRLVASYDEQPEDEESTQRDLSYEFKMPNPLRRALGDIVGAVMNVVTTFDPNGMNVELMRSLLLVALSDGFEVQDAAEVVERIFPPGFVPPALQMAQQQMAQGAAAAAGGGAPGAMPAPDDHGEFGGADGQQHTQGNPYGGPQRAQTPEQVAEAARRRVRPEDWVRDQKPLWWPRDRRGDPLPVDLVEAWARKAGDTERRVETAQADGDDLFEQLVGPQVDVALAALENGNGNGAH